MFGFEPRDVWVTTRWWVGGQKEEVLMSCDHWAATTVLSSTIATTDLYCYCNLVPQPASAQLLLNSSLLLLFYCDHCSHQYLSLRSEYILNFSFFLLHNILTNGEITS